MRKFITFGLAFLLVALTVAACSGDRSPGEITLYSGRAEDLVGPIIERFRKETGIQVKVRYGGTAELTATILEEGKNSPADVFWAQDAGALGAIAKGGRFSVLPNSTLEKVEARFRSPQGQWVGITGRARVLVYNTTKLKPEELPDSVYGLTEAKWKGRVGWAPSNGSFQAFVTAMRVLDGEAKTKKWLEDMKANNTKAYTSNTTKLNAVASGEIDVALNNHYYLYTALKDKGPSFSARNYYFRSGDAGALINVAGVGLLSSSKNQAAAKQFVDYLLAKEAQSYFSGDTPSDAFEYPLVAGIPVNPALPPLTQVKTPKLDLGSIDDLQGTLKLLRDVGLL